MTLRTTALIAGLLGILLLAGGLVADANRVDRTSVATTDIETSVVVIKPEVLALAADGRVMFYGDGPIEARTARGVDADAWITGVSATFVTGLPEWGVLSTRLAERVVVTDDEETDEDEATDDEATDDEATDEASESGLVYASADHWRDTWRGTDSLSISVAAIPAGMPLVVEATDGESLSSVSMMIERDVNDGWITPLVWWGAVLTALGAVALVFLIIDLRPLQARGESWIARRRRRAVENAGEPRPGSRRARRAEGSAIPVADIDEIDAHANANANAAPSANDSEPAPPDNSSGVPTTAQGNATPWGSVHGAASDKERS